MRTEENFLADIILACKAARRFVGDMTAEELEKSDLHLSAVLYQLIMIGEAAKNVSRGLKSRHPYVDWQSLTHFRNFVAHEYFTMDAPIVWTTANSNTSVLIKQIQTVLSVEFPEFTWSTVD